MIGRLIYNILNTDVELSRIIKVNSKNQIYPVVIPQTRGYTTSPQNAILYKITSQEPVISKDGYEGLLDIGFEVQILGKEYGTVQDMNILSFNALHNQTKQSLTGSPSVQSIIMTDSSEEEWEEETEMYSITQYYIARVYDINNEL